MKKVNSKNSFYLTDSIVPQAFFMRNTQIYYFDKLNKYEGRFCVKDDYGEKILFEIGDGCGVFDNNGDMYILNIDLDCRITRYSAKNKFTTDFQMDGIFYDLKVDEDGNYIFLGNVNEKTVIKLLDRNYNLKAMITPKKIIFGSSIYIQDENILLGAVGENDKLKVIKLNYIGSVIESYDINVKSKNRIISKIELFENYLVTLIGGERDSIVLYNMLSGYSKEVFLNQLGIKKAADICINDRNLLILCERKIFAFELNELLFNRICAPLLDFGIDLDNSLYIKLMYSTQLYESYYKYLFISIAMSLFEFLVLYVLNFINPYGIFEIAAFVTAFTFVFNYCLGVCSSIMKLYRKYNRVEKLLCVFSREYSIIGIYISSLLNAIIAGTIAYGVFSKEIFNKFYIIFGIVIFFADVLINITAQIRINFLQKDVIIELLEDDDIKVKKYIKNLSDNMNKGGVNTLSINIVCERSIDNNIAALWLKSRKSILKNEIQYFVNQNKMTALFDLSSRDVKYSKYNIIMDFVCFIRIKTSIRELSIEILENKLE